MKKILFSYCAILYLSSALLVNAQQDTADELLTITLHFSWETVPVYIHFGKNDGLSDEEVNFVATHSRFLCVWKKLTG